MLEEKITYWKDLAKAAFTDAAMMPFALPQNIYERKKASGAAEEVAANMRKDAKEAVNWTVCLGALYGMLSIYEGASPAVTAAEAIGIPYTMLLLCAGAATYVVNSDPEKTDAQKKNFQGYFWPNVTDTMERHAAAKTKPGAMP